MWQGLYEWIEWRCGAQEQNHEQTTDRTERRTHRR
ncbi:hypothetical protein F0521_05360 [Ferrimonas sp. YFM]|nr:hypothetical protein F0521_05360 [Ferrimonas sp. YFM]